MVCNFCDEPIPPEEMAAHMKIHIKRHGLKHIKKVVREKVWGNER
jgi:hypothetical protein